MEPFEANRATIETMEHGDNPKKYDQPRVLQSADQYYKRKLLITYFFLTYLYIIVIITSATFYFIKSPPNT